MNKPQILVITSSIDETASYLEKKYSDRAEFHRTNIDELGKYNISITNCGWRIERETIINDKDIHAIYYRKPLLPRIDDYYIQYQSMIRRDIVAVVTGLIDAFEGKVLSKPFILRKTENKIYQLLYAQQNGFLIPESYIGNCSDMAVKYLDKTAIIKPITTGKTYSNDRIEVYHTRMFEAFEDDICITPVYLQSFIPKQYEVRLTIIDQVAYAVRIDTLNKVDWRLDYQNHKYTLINCPEKIYTQCLKMLDDFGLSFGAFDFIVTPEDNWVFLEINPNGQWLWLEMSLNLDISRRIVDYLVS